MLAFLKISNVDKTNVSKVEPSSLSPFSIASTSNRNAFVLSIASSKLTSAIEMNDFHVIEIVNSRWRIQN